MPTYVRRREGSTDPTTYNIINDMRLLRMIGQPPGRLVVDDNHVCMPAGTRSHARTQVID